MAGKISEDLSSAKHPDIQGFLALIIEALVPESEESIVRRGYLERTWKMARVEL